MLPDLVRPARWPPPYRTGVVIAVIAIVMASAFALSYSLALGRPQAHDIRIGVTGDAAVSAPLVRTLQSGSSGGIQARDYPSLSAARTAVDDQEIYAIVDGAGTRARLYLSSASAPSVSRVLLQIVQRLPPSKAVQTTDLHALPSSDPQGLVTFYVTIAATLLGFVTVFQLRTHLSNVSMRQWSSIIGALAVVGGAVLTVVSDPGLHALTGPFPEIWLLLTLQCGIAALFNSTMVTWIGKWAMIPTWALFVVLGNTSSGGAIAAPLLPQPYAFLNRFLPTGATVSALHTAAYFPDTQHAEPFVVLGLWFTGSAVALAVCARVRHRTPAD